MRLCKRDHISYIMSTTKLDIRYISYILIWVNDYILGVILCLTSIYTSTWLVYHLEMLQNMVKQYCDISLRAQTAGLGHAWYSAMGESGAQQHYDMQGQGYYR